MSQALIIPWPCRDETSSDNQTIIIFFVLVVGGDTDTTTTIITTITIIKHINRFHLVFLYAPSHHTSQLRLKGPSDRPVVCDGNRRPSASFNSTPRDWNHSASFGPKSFSVRKGPQSCFSPRVMLQNAGHVLGSIVHYIAPPASTDQHLGQALSEASRIETSALAIPPLSSVLAHSIAEKNPAAPPPMTHTRGPAAVVRPLRRRSWPLQS